MEHSKIDYKGKKALVVDDDIDFLMQTKYHLEKEGFEVITAETRKDALSLLNEHKVDLVVSDLMMEQFDAGFTLAEAVRKKAGDIPFIICTSVRNDLGMEFNLETPEDHDWIKADAILSKPLRFEQLLKEIHKANLKREKTA